MKAKDFIIAYWIAIVLACVALELTDWLRLGEHDFQIWVIGFMARILFYFIVGVVGCIALIKLMDDLKIK
jgi:hypothetical protein